MREALAALLVAAPFGAGVATGAMTGTEPLFRFQDPAIVESSGLAVVDDGLVVTVNDSGDEARAFVVDPGSGRTVGTTRWQGGAEDVEAVAPGRDGTVWVGDIGDNGRDRASVSVVRIPVGPRDRDVVGERFVLRYPGGPADAEALLVHPRTGRLVVVTKDVLGGQVQVAPRELAAGAVQRTEPRGEVMPVVTDGAFLPDGDHLVLRDYARAVVYTWPALDQVAEVRLPPQRQGESLAVTASGTLLVGSEGVRSPVHEVALPDLTGERDQSPPLSREGRELPEQPGSAGPDPGPWLMGLGLFVVALVVLWAALRSPPHHPR